MKEKRGDEENALAGIISRGESAVKSMESKAAEIKPSAGLVQWNRGQATAAKNYNPPSTKPLG